MIDISSVVNQAKKTIERSSNNNGGSGGKRGGGDYKYKLIYPGVGETTVRLLYNPASSCVSRLIIRHYMNDEKVPCLRTWGISDCPICKAREEIKAATGNDLDRIAPRTRGISFAQFIDASYEIKDCPKQGDTILFMYPWTVYNGINQAIVEADGLSQKESKARGVTVPNGLILANDGVQFKVIHRPNHQYDTSASLYMTYHKFGTGEETGEALEAVQNQFETFLGELEPLNAQVLPERPTDAIMEQVNAAADSLRAHYLSKNIGPKESPVNQQVTNMASFNKSVSDEIPF